MVIYIKSRADTLCWLFTHFVFAPSSLLVSINAWRWLLGGVDDRRRTDRGILSSPPPFVFRGGLKFETFHHLQPNPRILVYKYYINIYIVDLSRAVGDGLCAMVEEEQQLPIR